MTDSKSKKPRFPWRLVSLPPKLLYKLGLGFIPGRFVLLLTTTGRRSKRPHTIPLQYEKINDAYYVGSARGRQADWFQNIEADPKVHVQVKNKRFAGIAETITAPSQIADFLEFRLQRHPKMVGRILRQAGLSADHTRSDLEAYAANRALVVIHPA